jgi:hypothetical protein
MRGLQVKTRWIAVLAAGCAALAVLEVWSTGATGDYVASGPVAGDNPAPAIAALAHGHLSALGSNQPLMGLVSLILRAPLVAAANSLGASDLTSYRLGALACLLSVALLAAWIGRDRVRSRRDLVALAAAFAIVLAGPPTSEALSSGHPEEVLAAMLAAAAVLAAVKGRPASAGILLGLAIGTKQWAVFAAVPVLAALPANRTKAIVVAAAVAAAATLPIAIADPGAFTRAGHDVGATHLINPLSAWWPSGSALPAAGGAELAAVRALPAGLSRTDASALALGLVVVVGAVALVAGYRLRRRADALALLAVVMLVRLVVDPLPILYYAVPAIVALVLWEAVVVRRLPVVALFLTAALTLTADQRIGLSPHLLNAAVLASVAVTCAWLLRTVDVVQVERGVAAINVG